MPNFKEMMKSPIISQIEPEIIPVLLIEDNPGDARLVKEKLNEARGGKFSLEHVTHVSEGLSRLSREDFQVLLLDLSLPDGFGLGMVIRCVQDSFIYP
jgi:CheY-like chemotaxis protein